ncbi:MAG: hypothetical protein LBO70_01020, partial [Clostridiales Family XIII bacterium]|nr:hypothetical protein [Clostridiales Family XIII bacterium]
MLSNLSSGEGGAGNSAMENNVNISDNHVKDRDGAVSGAIVRENIRRFWPIGLVSLLIYVAMGPVTWIISPPLQQETIISGEESTTIIHASPINYSAFAFIGMIFAAVVAIAVFRYMHSPAALSALHAFPVRKRALFFSNFVSGLLLIFVPFIAAVLSLLPLIAARSDAPSLMASWLTWLVAVCITVFFTYAVSVLAGMVSGTTPAHMLTAGVFNFAWIAIYGSAAAIVTESMFGMSGESDFMSAGLYLHPLTYFLSGIDVNTIVVGAGEVVPLYVGMPVYLAVSVLVLAASYFVFMRFKAERAGMPITARPVEHIFAFAVSAIGMFLFAVIFASQDPVRLSPDGQQPADPMTYVNTYAVLGAVIGAVVSFLIATMIIRKSARVFDLAALRRFGIFAAAAAV